MGSKRRTRSPSTDPPPPSRRRRLNGWPLEWRDWPALPGDVLWVILSLIPQADALLGAGLACASWWRVAAGEPLLWRHINLADEKTYPPAACQAMARAAVQRSCGRYESFGGRVDGDVLPFLVHSAPSLRSLHVTRLHDMSSEKFIAVVAEKLPLLDQLVLSHGLIQQDSLVALANHCPRLRLLDAGRCETLYPIDKALRQRLESRIKDLRLPHLRREWPPLRRESRQQVYSYSVQMHKQ